MTESSTPSKFEKWKRPLIGGILSALVIGTPLLFFYIVYSQPSAFLNIFTEPGVFISELLGRVAVDVTLTDIWLSLLCWFLLGFSLAYMMKNNKKAIGCWFLLMSIYLVFGLLLNYLAQHID